MLLNDLAGWIRRNSRNWDTRQIQKCLVEINSIKNYLERLLKDKGVA
jgi:hypothetical protein